MLAKAVATECDTTFFNVSSSTVVSKWRGDSEKLVRVLFELANFHAPSTVFIDEIDALMSARGGGGGGGGEHEASRRMKTELLIQMDGLASPDTANGVFVLCATNLPWELDLAMLRRLEKRVLVGLPNEDARAAMTTNLLGPHKRDAAVSLGWVAKETEGYSGSDVATLCKEMAMRPLRRLMERLEGEGRRAPRAAPPSVGSITEEDARAAMEVTKPSAVLHLSRYEDWCAQFGDHRH
jgi:katanin p60 ATPase-containing subunit A1